MDNVKVRRANRVHDENNGWDVAKYLLGHERESDAGAHSAAPRAWLRTKANSIEGGTSKVQLGIVAKRILELPA